MPDMEKTMPGVSSVNAAGALYDFLLGTTVFTTLADTGFLATQFAQEIQLGAANDPLTDQFNIVDSR
jgi:hypothetical protein